MNLSPKNGKIFYTFLLKEWEINFSQQRIMGNQVMQVGVVVLSLPFTSGGLGSSPVWSTS